MVCACISPTRHLGPHSQLQGGPTVHLCSRTLYNPFQSVIIALFVVILARDTVLVSTKPRPSSTFTPKARSSPSLRIPVIPTPFLRFTRLQHRDKHCMRDCANRLDSFPYPWFCECFPLACLGFITVVILHAETVSPLEIFRGLQCFGESVCCICLGRFFHHDQLFSSCFA